jgi:hypothetical protein
VEDSDHSSDDDDDAQSNASSVRGASGQNQSTVFPFVSNKRTWQHLIDALPRREHAEMLTEIYFNFVSHLFEPVQKTVFIKLYLHVAYSHSVQRYHASNLHVKHIDVQRLAVVYAVLALGAAYDVDAPTPRMQEAKLYSKASQMCLSTSQFMLHPTIASVECLQLLATFAFNTSKQA